MNLKATLKSWRDAAGLSRDQAALRLQVSVATYIRWEQGTSAPKSLAHWAIIKREVGQ